MQLLESLVTSPALASTVLGGFVPMLYRFLTEGGVEIPSKLKVWLNIALSAAVAFIPLIVSWSFRGVPTPEETWAAITAATVASEVAYRTWFKDRVPA